MRLTIACKHSAAFAWVPLARRAITLNIGVAQQCVDPERALDYLPRLSSRYLKAGHDRAREALTLNTMSYAYHHLTKRSQRGI